MSRLLIAIADEPAGTDRSAWWCAEVPRLWPTPGTRPRCQGVSYEGLRTALDEHAGIGAEGGGAALLLHTDTTPRASLMQAVDRLLGAHLPALVLAHDPESLRPELECVGVPVRPLDANPELVATILHTLVTRQASVDLLVTDLRVSRASQGGLSGEIGRLHEELQLAGVVQRRFLPKVLPEPHGFEFGVFYRPCGFVSGDIYDAVMIDEHRAAFILADAVGHGVPAALLTLVISRTLRSADPDIFVDHPLASPARTLDRLNKELCVENEVGDRFATAVCGVVNAATGEVSLASAGHPPALVIDPGATATTVAGGEGPLLGVFAEVAYTQTAFVLRHGQTLLLFSDGFETAFPEPGANPAKAAASQAYIEHFAEATTVAGASRGGAQAALERLAADVDSQAGSLNQRDDLTALALRRLPHAGAQPAAARTAA
ncbi:MAG: serine/threonine-protein phosphatase [Phycisphaerales bacterium]|nr:serine/threonine-protein phosphatase [Phycisphaerales bacterium]